MEADPTRRFSDRADDYAKYRPDYPLAVLHYLVQEGILAPGMTIADVGSGTGILSRMFLDSGYQVYGVEPNNEMRAAAERILNGYDRFTSVNGRAEGTTLASHSVHIVTSGQAFHWFDRSAARREFERVLTSGGYVVLIWNDWEAMYAPFNRAYKDIVSRFSVRYDVVKQSNVSAGDAIAEFFAPGVYQLAHFDHHQLLDLAGIRGRLLSSSYSPTPNHDHYAPMLAELEKVFNIYQVGGQVRLSYKTSVYYGQLLARS